MGARLLAVPLAPLLLTQAVLVRRRIPVLPEATGPRTGSTAHGAGECPVRVTVVGESTAAGVGVDRIEDSLPVRLADELAHRHGRRVDWLIAARTGATATTVLHDLLPAAPRRRSDIAVIALGVNDTLRLTSPRSWRATISAIAAALHDRQDDDGQVLITGVPDLAGFPSLPRPLRTVLGAHARALDDELRSLAATEPHLRYVPLPTFLDADVPFAADGFHPSAASYRRWAAGLAAAVRW